MVGMEGKGSPKIPISNNYIPRLKPEEQSQGIQYGAVKLSARTHIGLCRDT